MIGAGCIPIYPPSARRAGIQGEVVMRVQVAADGAPTGISVLTSSGSDKLDRAVADALRACRFHPATSGGRPIAGVTDVPYRFSLAN